MYCKGKKTGVGKECKFCLPLFSIYLLCNKPLGLEIQRSVRASFILTRLIELDRRNKILIYEWISAPLSLSRSVCDASFLCQQVIFRWRATAALCLQCVSMGASFDRPPLVHSSPWGPRLLRCFFFFHFFLSSSSNEDHLSSSSRAPCLSVRDMQFLALFFHWFHLFLFCRIVLSLSLSVFVFFSYIRVNVSCSVLSILDCLKGFCVTVFI